MKRFFIFAFLCFCVLPNQAWADHFDLTKRENLDLRYYNNGEIIGPAWYTLPECDVAAAFTSDMPEYNLNFDNGIGYSGNGSLIYGSSLLTTWFTDPVSWGLIDYQSDMDIEVKIYSQVTKELLESVIMPAVPSGGSFDLSGFSGNIYFEFYTAFDDVKNPEWWDNDFSFRLKGIEYNFQPYSTPVPAAALLFGTGICGLFAMRGKLKGVKGY